MSIILIALSIALFLFSCAPREVIKKDMASGISSLSVTTIEKDGWQLEWDKTLKNARKEGRVVVYGSTAAAALKSHATNVIKDKFGLDLEITVSRGAETVPKIVTERRAGLYIPDLFVSGNTTAFQYLKPAGILKYQWENLLVLPDVINPQVWWEEKIP